MKHTEFVGKSFLQHGMRSSVSSLMLLIALSAALCAFASPVMAARQFTSAITPTADVGGRVTSYTITLVNTSTSGETMGSASIAIPSGYSAVSLGSTTASGGKSWSAIVVADAIKFRGTGGTDRLSPAQSASVSFTATAPAAGGTFTWTTSATTNVGDGGSSLTLVGLQPKVVVTGNNLPQAANDFITTDEDTAFTLAAPGVLGNDTDADGNALSAVLLTQPAAGQVTLNANGSLVYTPNADFNGNDSFTYAANDGIANSAAATVFITIAPVADDPVAEGDAFSTDEDRGLVVEAPGVLENDIDVDGDPLTAVIDEDVRHGTLTLNADGSFEYTPESNFNGDDSFTYHANDGGADSEIVTVNITVAAVNDAPVAISPAIGDGDYETDEETLLQIAAPGVLSNFTDSDGDTLTAVLDTDVREGVLTLNEDGSFDYTPGADFSGTDSFTFHANDGANDSEIVTVSITVNAVNDAPDAGDDSGSTLQDTALTVAAPGVLGNDTDVENDALTAALVSNVTNGTLTLNSDGSYSYTPNAGFYGSDSFTYAANDGTVDGNTATVTITVTRTYTISGLVRIGNVTPVAGVNVTRTGGVTVQTDANGRYVFSGLLPGGYFITASSASFTFSPASVGLSITNAGRSANFNAARIIPTYSITGRISTSNGVGIAGVSVTRSGSAVAAVSNSAGYYTFPSVPNGTYTLTPALEGYTLLPANKTVTVQDANVGGQNFISGWSITGRITSSNGAGIAGVSVSSGSGNPVLTTSQGYYTLWGLQAGTYTVTPSKDGVVFTPTSKTVTMGTSNVSGQNFMGLLP